MAQTIKLKRSATPGAIPSLGSLELGEIAINTYDGKLYIKKDDGTSPDTIVEVSGAGGVAGGDFTFLDNEKALFGTDSDLQIYHDGSDSYISDQGTGNLIIDGSTSTQIKGSSFVILRSSAGENMAVGNANGAFDLYYDGSKKLATTSTGIDVTGTATMDGLTVESATVVEVTLKNTDSDVASGEYLGKLHFEGSDSSTGAAGVRAGIYAQYGSSFGYTSLDLLTSISGGSLKKGMTINGDGDISFYNTAGTTPKFFWDASAESLGIGTTTPSAFLHLVGSNVNIALEPTGTNAYFDNRKVGGATNFRVSNVSTNDTTAMTLTSAGNVGIGTDSPNSRLHIKDNTSTVYDATAYQHNIFLEKRNTAGANQTTGLRFAVTGYDGSTTAEASIGILQTSNANSGNLVFGTRHNGTRAERMRISSAGNVGIGTTSPPSTLTVLGPNDATGGITLTSTETDTSNKIGRIKNAHYTNAEEPFTFVQTRSEVSDSIINLGGSSGVENAATRIGFWTAVDTTTLTGTEVMRVNSAQNVGIGETSTMVAGYKLQVRNDNNGESNPLLISNRDTSVATTQNVTLNFGLSRDSGAFKPQAGRIRVGREGNTWDADDANIDSYMDFSVYQSNALSTKLTIASDGRATFAGDIATPGIQMGSGSANDIQANGKTAYIGSAIFGDSAATNTPLAPVHIKGAGAPALRIEDLDNLNQVYDFISNEGVGLSIVDQTASITPLAFAHTTGNATFAADVIVTGDLTVNGTTTTVDTDNLTVKDNNITLNYSTGDSSSVADNAGITIQDAVDASTDASLLWKTASDSFLFSHKIRVPDVEIDGQTLTSSNDLDSLNDGFYKWASSKPANAPGSNNYMVMYQMTDPNQKIQIAWGASGSGKLYVRRADSGVFYAWTEMLTTASASSTYLPLAGGTLTGDATFPDNSKAIFGTDSDLQIYHDGSNSRILEAGAGFLAIGTNGTDIRLTGNNFNEYMAKFEQNGAATLYHDSLPKIATTATGIDVTGTIKSNAITISTGAVPLSFEETDQSDGFVGKWWRQPVDSGNLRWDVSLTGDDAFTTYRNVMQLNSDGNVGIGTPTPATPLHIYSSVGAGATKDMLTLQTYRGDFGSGGSSLLFFNTDSNSSNKARIRTYTVDPGEYKTDLIFSVSDRSNSAITSISANTTDITVVHVASLGLGVEVGDNVAIQSTTNFNGNFIVTGVTDSTTFTIAATGYDAFATETSGNVAKGETFDRMVIDSAGYVGIGTNTPGVPLQVNSDVEHQIKIESTASAGASMQLYSGGSSAYTVYQHPNANFRVGAYGGSSFIIRDQGNSADRLAIDSSGKVGIGTDAPQTLLDVEGAANTELLRVGISANENSTLLISPFTSSATNGLQTITSGSQFGTLIQGALNGKLVLATRDNDTSDSIDFVSGGGDWTADNIYDTTIATFRSDGNVGIGTNTPAAKLHIENGDMRIEKDTKATIGFRGHTTGSTALAFRDANAGIDRMTIDALGNVGISTGKNLELQTTTGVARGYISAQEFNTGGTHAAGLIIATSSGESITFKDNNIGGTTNMVIKGDGKVGIGTPSPSFKLHVSHDGGGDASFTGGILVENTGTTTGEPNLAFKNQDTGSNYWFTGLNQDTNYALTYGPTFEDPYNLFTLTSGGNLGVGGDPDPDERLVVTGSANGGSTAIVVQNEYSLASSVDESTDLQFRFYSAQTDNYTSGAQIRSTKTEDWMTTADASAKLVFYTREDNVLAPKMTILPSGNVGIGTNDPQAKLHVNEGPVYIGDYTGTVTPTEGIFLENAAGNSNTIAMYTYNASVFKIESDGLEANIGWGSTSNREVNFVNTGAGSIKVGINTTAPNYLLHLEDSNGADLALGNSLVSPSAGDYLGRIYALDSTNVFFAGINMFYHDADDGEMRFRVKTAGTNTDIMTLVDGSVGIGTTSPDRKLHLKDGQIKFQNTSSGGWAGLDFSMGNGTYDGYMGMADNDGKFFIDVDSNGNDFVILQNGNVGIGTNDPKQKVHSTNGFYTTGGIASPGAPPYTSYSGASFDWFDGYARLASWGADATTRGGYSFIQMQSDGESQQTAMTIDSLGKVGIGTTSPGGDLQIGNFTGSRKLMLSGANDTSDSSQIIFTDSSGQPSPFYAGMGIRYDSTTNKLIIESHFDTGVSPNATTQPILTLDREDQSATFAADVIVTGDLFVTGASTAVNVEDLNVEQGEITLNYGTGDTSAAANGAGIRIQDAVDASTDATILWNTTSDKFEFSHGIISAGPIAGSNLSGINTGDEPNASASVAGIVTTGTQTFAGNKTFNGSVTLNNTSLSGVNNLSFQDPGPGEGINWAGGNFAIYESPNDLITNTAGNLQFVSGGVRRVTFDTSGNVDVTGSISASNLSGTNTGDEPNASTTVKGIVELATTAETTTGTDATRAVTPDGLKDGYQGSTNVTTLGTITTGTWNGTAIASAYLDADTAHLSGTQTFTGNKTFSGGLGVSSTSPTFIINDSDATNATNQVGYISFQRQSAEKAWIGYGSSSNPNFTIKNTEGAVTIDSNVDVTGTLTATSKSFDIEHPTKEGMRLRYGSLEGPENGVYVRGRMDGEQVIQLPDYWLGLVHEDTITVNLTSIGPGSVWVESIENNTITVGGSEKFFYHVFAERKDIEKLTVEYDV